MKIYNDMLIYSYLEYSTDSFMYENEINIQSIVESITTKRNIILVSKLWLKISVFETY